MKNKVQNLVDCFTNSSYEDYKGDTYFSLGMDKIYFNEELVCYKHKGQTYIVNNIACLDSMTKLLNCFEGIEAKEKNGSIVINGIEWDGKKANLELFK